MATPQTINIALIDTDTPVPSVLSTRGLYSTIFQQLLEAALARLSKTTLFATQPLPKVQWATYNVVQGDYPPDIAPFDAFVISGSAASAYDTDPWIITLEAWIRTAFTTRPHAKFFGSCFGHQILCSALLSSPAVPPADVVTKNAAGWELGVLPIALSPAFLRAFPVDVRALPSAKRGDVLRLQMVHADHVVMPPEAGARWCVMGGTPRCAVQGVYEAAQGRVFTLQGHFEFDRFVNGETIKVFGKGWGEESIREVLKDVDADDDAEWAAEVVMAFLLGLGRDGGGCLMRVPIGEGGAVMEGGMMTPPEEV